MTEQSLALLHSSRVEKALHKLRGSGGTSQKCCYVWQRTSTLTAGCGGSIGCTSTWYAERRGFDPHVQQHSFLEFGHEIISMAIICLLLIQEGQLSVTGRSPSLISFHCALNRYLRAQCFFMQAEKTDQTGRMPRLICVFAGCTTHFVGFVMWRLNYKYVTRHILSFTLLNKNFVHVLLYILVHKMICPNTDT